MNKQDDYFAVGYGADLGGLLDDGLGMPHRMLRTKPLYMAKHEQYHKRTGRTVRLLNDAVNLCIEHNKAVYILCSEKAIPSIRKQLFELLPLSYRDIINTRIKLETINSIGECNIDWVNNCIIGAHSNCVLLIDHYVWSEKFGFAINGYHKYDVDMLEPLKYVELRQEIKE